MFISTKKDFSMNNIEKSNIQLNGSAINGFSAIAKEKEKPYIQ